MALWTSSSTYAIECITSSTVAEGSWGRTAQCDGIWAWDAVHREPVLVLPWVLALLGDNPMQSEFACHMGMRAKRFCRVCEVKGRDMADDDDHAGEGRSRDESEISEGSDEDIEASEGGDNEGLSGGEESGADGTRARKPGKGKKKMEGMSDMLTRVRNFLKVRSWLMNVV